MMYFPFIILIMPFKSIINNILEIVNELFYGVVLGFLLFLSSEERWDNYEDIFFNILLANSYAIVIIMVCK